MLFNYRDGHLLSLRHTFPLAQTPPMMLSENAKFVKIKIIFFVDI